MLWVMRCMVRTAGQSSTSAITATCRNTSAMSNRQARLKMPNTSVSVEATMTALFTPKQLTMPKVALTTIMHSTAASTKLLDRVR